MKPTSQVPRPIPIQSSIDEKSDEVALVSRVRSREPAACEILVRTYGGQLLATARRYLRCEQDCADAVQETFIAAFQAIARFEGNSKLATWLHRILVNACLMKLRGRARQPEVSIDELLPTFDKSGHHSRPIRGWWTT